MVVDTHEKQRGIANPVLHNLYMCNFTIANPLGETFGRFIVNYCHYHLVMGLEGSFTINLSLLCSGQSVGTET